MNDFHEIAIKVDNIKARWPNYVTIQDLRRCKQSVWTSEVDAESCFATDP